MRNTFILHTAYADKFRKLSDEQFGKLMRVLIAYQATGEEPEFDDLSLSLAFDVAKVELDAANEKYEQTCERRKQAGSKGGTAKVANARFAKNDVAKVANAKFATNDVAKKAKGSKSKHNDNDNDNENDNENDNDNDISSNDDIKTIAQSDKNHSEPVADVAAIPLNDGTEWTPTERLYEEYKKLYPNVDVKQQFNTMRAWCISNPGKRKTKTGVTRFVNTWLSKEQDRGHPIRSSNVVKPNQFSTFEKRATTDDEYAAMERQKLGVT